jgi:hypothetical protein
MQQQINLATVQVGVASGTCSHIHISTGRNRRFPFLQLSVATSEILNMSNVTISASAGQDTESHSRSIDALAMRCKPTPRPRNSWLNTVGKFPKGSRIDRIFEVGRRIREDECNEE